MSRLCYVRAYFKDMGTDDFPIDIERDLIQVIASYRKTNIDEVYSYETHDGAMSTFLASQLVGLRTFTPESRETIERNQAAINNEIKLVRQDLGIFDPDYS